jgi:hypothetical protein
MNTPPKITGPKPSGKKYLRVEARNIGDVEDFIDDLREALQSAKQDGGTRSAFLHLPGGVNVLQVEVTCHLGAKK